MDGVSIIQTLFRVVIALVVVVALMLAFSSYLKKGNGIGGISRKRGVIEIVARQGLSRNASIALVRTGNRALLLGVTDTNVTLLLDSDPEDLIEEPEPLGTVAQAGPSGSFPTWKTLIDSMRDRTVRRP